MSKTTSETIDFSTFARNFKEKHGETLEAWVNHGDQLHKAVAQIIIEAVPGGVA